MNAVRLRRLSVAKQEHLCHDEFLKFKKVSISMAHQHSFSIKETENKGLKRAYQVVVSAEEIEADVDAELQKVGRKVKIAGFRPGKVPANVLKQRYGKSVLGDVIDHLVQHAVHDVMEKNQVAPALKPNVEIKDFKEGGDLTIAMSFEIMPSAPEIDFSKISVEKPVYQIGDEEIEESLSRIAESNRDLKDKKGAAKKSDVVKIDFKGYIDDVAFEGGEAQGFNLELGSGSFIEGFEDQLIGAKAGDEKDVNVTFPKTYHKEDLQGKKAKFEVKVHSIQEPELPELNDAFASKLGVESLEKLKELVKGQLDQEYSGMARSQVKKALFDALEKECTFEIPEGMFKLEYDSIWQQVQEAKKQGDPELDKPDAELKKEYEAVARRRVALGILLSQTAGKQKLEVTTEDLRNAILGQARHYPGQERKVIEFYNKNPDEVNQFRGPILEEKAVDFILEKVKYKEKKVSREELLNPESARGKKSAKKSDKGEAKEAAPKAKKSGKKE